jgi:hypothetical protein
MFWLIAKEFYDGHATIMRFTTNFRADFGSQTKFNLGMEGREYIQRMSVGKTIHEAMRKAILNFLENGPEDEDSIELTTKLVWKYSPESSDLKQD